MAACSLAWDYEPLEGGVCPEGMKACDEDCIPTSDPEFGCARPGCAACSLPNAVAVCNEGECRVSICVERFKDCDGDRRDCEVDTGFDPDNCGACGEVCPPPPNGAPACSSGHCTLGGCLPGFGSCDGQSENGCEEDLLSSPEHCGSCNRGCADDQSCVGGECR